MQNQRTIFIVSISIKVHWSIYVIYEAQIPFIKFFNLKNDPLELKDLTDNNEDI